MVTIHPLNLKNLQELIDISKKTFTETFAKDNSDEDLQKYLNDSLSLEKITSELNNKNSFFYFAKISNQIIGYLKLNTADAQTENKIPQAVEIERIYVLKEFHGKAIGQTLLNFAIEFAKKQQLDILWLGVWEHNERAISFYKKNNFIAFDKHIFKLGGDLQTDILMKLKL